MIPCCVQDVIVEKDEECEMKTTGSRKILQFHSLATHEFPMPLYVLAWQTVAGEVAAQSGT